MSQDREFDTYIQGKSDLSGVYADLPQAKPPAHLDAAILAEAHRAVGARPGGKPRRSWVIPLSVAASLFVVVVIGLQLPYLMPRTDLSSRAPKAARPTEGKMDEGAPEKTASAHGQPEIAPVAPPPAPADKALISPKMAAPPAPAPEPALQMNAPVQAFESKPTAAKPVAPAAPVEAPAVAERQRSLEQAESSREAAGQEKKAAARSKRKAADDAAQPAPAAATMAAPEALGKASGAQVTDKAEMATLPAADWLARIRTLEQQGKPDEARKELAAFRKRYPDYPVPKDLELR